MVSAWVMLGATLASTAWVSLQVKESLDKEAAREFAFACDKLVLKIQERLVTYALVLRGGAALFAASREVGRENWSAYVATLRAVDSVPGIEGIGFAMRLSAGDLGVHIAGVRAQGFPGYRVWPAGERASYTSIVYLEPFRGRNLRAFGYDMFSDPVRRAAMEQARDSGEAALSGKVTLVQESASNDQAGTLMYVPVYRHGEKQDTAMERNAALMGWVYSPYRMTDLMTNVLRDPDGPPGGAFRLHIHDGRRATAGNLLFGSMCLHVPGDDSWVHQQRLLDFNGHLWLLGFDQSRTDHGVHYLTAWIALAVGLAASGLLFGLMLSLRNTQVRAEGIAHDLTEKIRDREKVAQTAVQYSRSLIEASLDPLLTIGSSGEITDLNEATEKVTGCTRQELVGTDFCDYFTEPDKARTGYKWVFDKSFVVDYPLALRHRDGHITDVLYNASVYRDPAGVVLGVFAAARDVTARKRVEEQINELNRDLEQRVLKRTAELKTANEGMEAFSYSVSHDLRTPLRAIDGFSRILLDEYGGKIDAEGRRLLIVVRDNTRRMGQLIDDMLEFSRAGRMELNYSAIGMEAMANEVLDEIRTETPVPGLRVHIGPLHAVGGDRAMMRQVWVNLLSNAVKFSQIKPAARITVGSALAGDEVTFFVRDNGVGFDMEFVGKLFGVFQRLHGISEFEGTGIGLALVKQVITRHGGRVWAEGKVGEGATFYFSMPAKEKDHG